MHVHLAFAAAFFAFPSLLQSTIAPPSGADGATPAGVATVAPPDAPTAPGEPAHDLSVQISAYVRRVYQDRAGYLWFGTNSDGVCRYDGKSLVYFGAKDGFAGDAVRGIVQTGDGAMWFATDNGVCRYHDGKFATYTEADGLSSNNTWSMMLDRGGTLWIGTIGGVCRYVDAAKEEARREKESGTQNSKRFESFPIPRSGIEKPESRFDPKLVWSMYEDRDGHIWFGTDGDGARRFDGKTFATYTTNDGLGGNQVWCISGDRQGRIWLGGEAGGVTCFDGKTFRNFRAKDGLGNDRVYTMLEDKSGNLWFSTLGDGVSRYDGKSFTVYRQLGGLHGTHVQSILEDTHGTLWFGCSGGLFRFDGTSFVNVTRKGPWQ